MGNPIEIGEDKNMFCILVYTGNHYDRIVFRRHSSNPLTTSFDIAGDVTRWAAPNERVLGRAKELVRKLNKLRAYLNKGHDQIKKCDDPNCNWVGTDLEGDWHSRGHEHLNFTHVGEDPTISLVCDSENCDWTGTGVAAAIVHRAMTHHRAWRCVEDN
jgi:hypothetical protein